MDPFSKDTKTPTNTDTAAPAADTKPVTPASPTPETPAGPVTPPSTTTTPTVAPTTPVSVAPTLGPTPAVNASEAVQTGHVEKSNKLLYLFIGLLLVILLGLIGLFFYNQIYDATAAESKIVVPTTIPATPTVVVPTYASEEEKEVMGVEVGAVESQLNIIEQDVNKL